MFELKTDDQNQITPLSIKSVENTFEMHINYECEILPEDSLNYAVYINDLKEKEDGIIKEFYKSHG